MAKTLILSLLLMTFGAVTWDAVFDIEWSGGTQAADVRAKDIDGCPIVP